MAGLVVTMLAAALVAMARILSADGFGYGDAALLACFAAMLPWNVIGFWNALIGLVILHGSRDPVAAVLPAARALGPSMPLRSRVAVIMPVYNEEPDRVLRHLAATVASLDATGAGAGFEIFLLSDTSDSGIGSREEALFRTWSARTRRPGGLHYRRRRENEGHKTGNIWEWLEREGRRFDHMIVLDADSVMSGAALLRLVRIMEANPEIGILQQLVVGLPNTSPFARIFQFGMRHGMRAYAVGSAWWQGDCGPYWGHNAIVRIAPFMAHCRLPEIPGGPPLGGRVLSHDQVEAVLMRRAGWQVRVLPVEEGSYEENPPTLLDFIKRDLRWCQGNWQYVHLLGRPGLHRMGRLQLLLAILMYVSGPAWVLFSLLGLGGAVLSGLAPAPPVASGPGVAWLGMPGAWEGWALLGAMVVIVFAPKLAGTAQVLLSPRARTAYGGGPCVLLSALVELLFGLILAPIVAVAQALFVLGMAAGRTIRWEAQRRDSRELAWTEAVRGLWPHSALGLGVGTAVWLLAPAGALIWAVLFCAPLVLAVPFARVTSRVGWGRRLARHRICAVPEETEPPAVLVAAGHALQTSPGPARAAGAGYGPAGAPAIDAPAAPPVD